MIARPATAPRAARGFTWIEMLLVLAVLGILAMMAIPAMQEHVLRRQVKEALPLAEIARKGVQAAWSATGEMPADNTAAGLPPPEKIVGNLVKAVRVDGGAVTLTFGNNASKVLEDRQLTLRPAIVADTPVVPMAWLCHRAPVPQGMEVRGEDRTDVPQSQLPAECRGAGP